MRRTRGNQEVASASKDDLAIKLDAGIGQSIRKPVANYVAKKEHVRLGRTGASVFGQWQVRGTPCNDADV